MTAYLPALIWLFSHVACLLIARRRLVKPTAVRTMLAAVAGPIALPFVLAAKPDKFNRA